MFAKAAVLSRLPTSCRRSLIGLNNPSFPFRFSLAVNSFSKWATLVLNMLILSAAAAAEEVSKSLCGVHSVRIGFL